VLVETLATAEAAVVGEFEAATPLGLLAAFTPTTSMDRATIAVMIKADKKATTCLRILFSPVDFTFCIYPEIMEEPYFSDRLFGNCRNAGIFSVLGAIPNSLYTLYSI
jgi:hypothetical protein